MALNYDKIHVNRILQYLRQIKNLYGDFAFASCVIALGSEAGKLFTFDKKLKKDFENVKSSFYNSLNGLIQTGIATQWIYANKKHDSILRKGLIPNHNENALKSFQNRKIHGLTLSERVWNLSNQHKTELEFAISLALKDGQSAQELSRDVRKHLNNPDKLFRKVRNKHGNLTLSKNAKAFHPGQGVYRSSYKNALRLASNEINLAYRSSEQLRIMQNNDVVGVDIVLSSSHPTPDMCDHLKGKYPKDFVWDAWHIGCLCHRRMILKTEDELFAEIENGEILPPESSVNFISDIPKNAQIWIEENAERIEKMKSKPNWIEKNEIHIITPQ